MKKVIKRIFALLLVCLLIASAGWYMFVYDRDTVRDLLSDAARSCARHGNFSGATWFYGLSYEISEQDQNIAIELADIYKSVDNYTKAEVTLSGAIADGGDAELYMALCKTYVEQDKILDALNMLEKITDPTIKAQLDAMRPAAPTADFESGFYNQYITVTFSGEGGTLFVTTDGEYPTIAREPVTEPITLPAGETKVYAVTVADNGLVSPLAIFNYTIGGVIEQVELKDPAMEAVLRAELLFGQDTEIFSDDLWAIREFSVPVEAQSLEDLRHLTQLRKLTITQQSIDSLSFLPGMTHLEELVIKDCTLSDSLAPIAALPALRSLTLSGCSLSTAAELEPAVGLKALDLSKNAIGNLSPLSGMTAMEDLDLSGNAVTDLSVLSGMPQLKSLDCSHNAVSSMAPLASCKNLTRLDLAGNRITSITALDDMAELRELDLSGNAITSVSPLTRCVGLEKLDLAKNQLTDLSPLSGLSALRELDFSENAVTVLPDFPEGSQLAVLRADHNQLTDISSLAKLQRLNYFYADYNPGLEDISPLLQCPQLIQVNVYGPKVSDQVVNSLTDRSVIVNYDPTAKSLEELEREQKKTT